MEMWGGGFLSGMSSPGLHFLMVLSFLSGSTVSALFQIEGTPGDQVTTHRLSILPDCYLIEQL